MPKRWHIEQKFVLRGNRKSGVDYRLGPLPTPYLPPFPPNVGTILRRIIYWPPTICGLSTVLYDTRPQYWYDAGKQYIDWTGCIWEILINAEWPTYQMLKRLWRQLMKHKIHDIIKFVTFIRCVIETATSLYSHTLSFVLHYGFNFIVVASSRFMPIFHASTFSVSF